MNIIDEPLLQDQMNPIEFMQYTSASQHADLYSRLSNHTSNWDIHLTKDDKKKLDKSVTEGDVKDINDSIDSINTKVQELEEQSEDYATKDYVDDKIDEIVIPQGPQGPKGDDGDKGDKGDNGKSAYQVYVDSVVPPQVPKTEQQWLDSLKGQDGDTPQITVNSVTTLNPGQNATVVNSGTSTDVQLDFGIPKGVQGDTPTVTIGSVSTLDSTQSATVTATTTTTGVALNFGIPKGQPGSAAEGLPSGGSEGQVLAKYSNSDYDVHWVNQSGGGSVSGITDPYINFNNTALIIASDSSNIVTTDIPQGYTYYVNTHPHSRSDIALGDRSLILTDDIIVTDASSSPTTLNKGLSCGEVVTIATSGGTGTFQIPSFFMVYGPDGQTPYKLVFNKGILTSVELVQ